MPHASITHNQSKTMERVKFITVSIIFLVAVTIFDHQKIKSDNNQLKVETASILPNTEPPCIQMYYYIEIFSKKYNIPRQYAYGIAYKETGYRGPFHWHYNHRLTSSAGALGPMQIMPTTATHINGQRVSNEKLKTDIEYNVETSMKLLNTLKEKYGSWEVAFGAYNTGRPMVNQYAHDVYRFEPNW